MFHLTYDILIKISKDVKFKSPNYKLFAVLQTEVYLTYGSNRCPFAAAKSQFLSQFM